MSMHRTVPKSTAIALALAWTSCATALHAMPPTGLADADDPPLAEAYAPAADRAAEWIDAGKLRDADRLLRHLTRKASRPPHPRIVGLTALLQLERGETDAAWRTIDSLIDMQPGYRRQRFECYLAAGRVLNARRETAPAVERYEWMLANETGDTQRRRRRCCAPGRWWGACADFLFHPRPAYARTPSVG